MTLIAEDVLLLLLGDDSGKPIVDSTKLPRVLSGAIVLELAMSGAIRVSGDDESVKKGRVVVAEDAAPTDPLLARATDAIRASSRPMTPKRTIEKLHKGLHDDLIARLIDQGFIGEEKGKMLGLFPTTAWPARDSSHEDAVRHTLQQVLVEGESPSATTSALVSLLAAIDAVTKVFPDEDKKSINKRAKDIADDEWAGEAVRKAVQDVQTAVMVAIMVPVMTTTTT